MYMEKTTVCSPCELRKFVIPEIITGIDAGLLIGRYLEHFGARKPMIVTDKGVRELRWFRKIEKEISSHARSYHIFDQVTPNPKDTEVMRGAKQFLDEHCDLVVAVGGGSPMDCAKCISIVSTNGGHILDYEGVDEVALPGPPLICIPTTAGTSADVSQFAIILDTGASVKKAIISKKVIPDLALIDPIPLMEMDHYLTACTGMDALTHAVEAYVSNAQSSLTDIHALEAIRIITENIRDAVTDNRTIDTMCRMMFGSIQAGLAFSNASLGAVHAMAHSLGGLYDLPHGECNSILLGPVIAYNFESAPGRYRKIAEQMGIPAAGSSDSEVKKKLLNGIKTMLEHLNIKPFISLDGVGKDIDRLAESALNDPCMVTNPRALTKEEVKEIYERVVRFEK
jgi:alcohol dehydrogenase class IV